MKIDRGVEPTGSPTLKASLDAGHVVTLPEVTRRVPTMTCRRTDDRIFEIVDRNVDDIVLVTDEAMRRGVRTGCGSRSASPPISPARPRLPRSARSRATSAVPGTSARWSAAPAPRGRSEALPQSRVTAIASISIRRSSKAKPVTRTAVTAGPGVP